jgi:predicted metal-dependent peptidase
MKKIQSKVSEAFKAVGDGCASFAYHWPMLAGIVYRFKFVESAEVPTFATDGLTCYYNPQFVLQGTGLKPEGPMTLDELRWVLLHEVGHVWLGHHLRLTDKDPTLRNVAFDIANHEVIPLPPTQRLLDMICRAGSGKFAKLPGKREAEWYYSAFAPPPQPPQPQPSADGESDADGDSDANNDADADGNAQGDKGNADGDASGEQSDTDRESDADGDSDANNDADADGNASGDKGNAKGDAPGNESDIDGNDHPSKGLPISESFSLGDVLPAPNTDTPEAAAQAEREWQEVVAETLAISKQCGNAPGWLKDIGEKMLGQSEIDWRLVLRRFLSKMVPTGTTYTRPSRRGAWRTDVILPAHRSKGGADGVIIADVSGSIFSQVKKYICPEIQKILDGLPKTSVDLVQIDTEIRSEATYTRYSGPLTVDIQGGGGTNLDPAFELAAQRRAKYRWCIVITDFEWDYKNAPNPNIPTLWVAVNCDSAPEKPKFGDVIVASPR